MTMTASSESALQGRVDAVIDACTRCGKCVEVCPATEPAGLSAEQRQNPVISGVIDLLRGSAGNDAARKWASGCLLSGECIKGCDYGVNPRFLLGMARVAMAKVKDDAAPRRSRGLSQGSARRQRVAAAATRRCTVGAARPGSTTERGGGAARFRVLYRLQHAQDAAHRARRHGRARHQL
jgi:Fe-S oxidoreductase